MTLLIILGTYTLGMLITARIIGNDIYRGNQQSYGENDSYGWTAFALVWPIIALIFGWRWWATGAERKARRIAHKESKARDKAQELREAKTRERDEAMRPWNLMLRDPDASEEQKALAQQILRDLALK